MRRWLVTGGAGFIGSHLCDALVARGDDVRVLDDLSTGFAANLPAKATLIEADAADPVAVADAVQGVDGCFHLAAIASVEKGVTDWLGTHRTNLTAAITLFDAIRKQRSRIPVVYASSAAVYGDCHVVPVAETTPCGPLSAYGADKYGCELHARVASHVHDIPTTGLRFFNVYGPRQNPRSPYSGVISIFCERIRTNAPVHVFGDGAQTRDFVYVSDVVAALLGAMALNEPARRTGTPTEATIFNVCTGHPTSVIELAEVIADLCGRSLLMMPKPARAGEIRHSLGIPALADQTLKLPPRMTLRDGLARVLAWLETYR